MCLHCQAPFYDMRRQPITCPKCGATHQPVAALKSEGRQPRRNQPRAAPVVTPAAEVEATSSIDPEDSEMDSEAEDDIDDAEAVTEDVEPTSEKAER